MSTDANTSDSSQRGETLAGLQEEARSRGCQIEPMSWENYHDRPGINQSAVKEVLTDPTLYGQRLRGEAPPRPTTAAMQWGKDLEAYLFDGAEPGIVIPENVLSATGRRQGRAWDEYETHMARTRPGVPLLKAHEYLEKAEPLIAAREQLRAHAEASELIWGDSVIQRIAVMFREPWTGRPAKAHLDAVHLRKGVIVDLKSTHDTRQEAFARSALNLGYHLQDRWYRTAMEAATGRRWRFVFVCVKNKPSHAAETYELEPDWEPIADARILQGLAAIAQGEQDGRWRTSSHGRIVRLRAPAWSLNTIDDLSGDDLSTEGDDE